MDGANPKDKSRHDSGRGPGRRPAGHEPADALNEASESRPGDTTDNGDAGVTGATPTGETASTPGAAGVPAGDELDTQLAALRAETDDLRSRLLRVSADYQNFVRRNQQSIADSRQLQVMELVKALLPALDVLDHALEVDVQKATAASVLQGVQMARGEFLKALAKFGVERLEAKPGEAFDPARHEALMQQQVPGIEPNHVATQLQPGYALGDKTVRPAKVSVAR